MSTHPNLLLFMPETLRADAVFGPPAARAKTPVLDALAAEGGAFTQAYCQSPFCAPSRSSIVTGLYPHTGGYRTFGHVVQAHEWNLFRELREAGYYTAAWGKNDMLARDAVPLAFDEYTLRVQPTDHGHYNNIHADPKHALSFYFGEGPAPSHDTDWAVLESALQFLDEPHDRPFCLYLPLEYAHPPYFVEEPFFSLHDRTAVPPPLPYSPEGKRAYVRAIHEAHGLGALTEADFREIRAVYFGMISRVDAMLGQLLDKLRERGLYDDTAIFCYSDHGDYTGDYGLTEKWTGAHEDCMLHVPLYCRVPGLPATGLHDGLVELVDLYPTIMDVAGVAPRHPHFGHSLLPALRGEAEVCRDAVFAESGVRPDELPRYLPPIPDGSLYAPHRDVVLHEPHCLERAAMVRTERYKYLYCPGERHELYDLQEDPGELRNLADEPALRAVRAELQERLLRWLLETSDVLPFERDSRGWQ